MVWLLATQWLWMIAIALGISTEFPNPQKEFRLCGRRNASFVCDPELILDVGDVERLNQLALGFRKSTTCLCSPCETGISLGIFIKRNLTQESMKTYPNGKSVAEMLRKRWHLGKCNDDIVIIVLTEMNISDYSMGSSVQTVFPDKTAKLIMNDCRVHFLSGWFYQGLESVVSSFNDVLIMLQKKEKSRSKSLITGVSLGIGVLLILLIISILILRRNKRRKKGCTDIYDDVPTKTSPDNYFNGKMNEHHLQELHKQNCGEEDDDNTSDEDIGDNTQLRRLLQTKRELSDVIEESSDDNETFKENENISFDTFPNSLKATNRSLQVTEL